MKGGPPACHGEGPPICAPRLATQARARVGQPLRAPALSSQGTEPLRAFPPRPRWGRSLTLHEENAPLLDLFRAPRGRRSFLAQLGQSAPIFAV